MGARLSEIFSGINWKDEDFIFAPGLFREGFIGPYRQFKSLCGINDLLSAPQYLLKTLGGEEMICYSYGKNKLYAYRPTPEQVEFVKKHDITNMREFLKLFEKDNDFLKDAKPTREPMIKKEEGSIISSLKRLERIGSEHSKTMLKIKAAAYEASSKIAKLAADAGIMTLPRGYTVGAYVKKMDEKEYVLYTILGTPCNKDMTAGDAVQLARDLANGLLNEIAIKIEEHEEELKELLNKI